MAAAKQSFKVTVGGHVQAPGPVMLKEGSTVMDAIESAGGATEFGSLRRVNLVRYADRTEHDLSKEPIAMIPLEPNDTILVPQKMVMGR